MYRNKFVTPIEFSQSDAELMGFCFDENEPLIHFFDTPFNGRYYVQLSEFGDFTIIPEGDPENYLILKRLKYMEQLHELIINLNIKMLENAECN